MFWHPEKQIQTWGGGKKSDLATVMDVYYLAKHTLGVYERGFREIQDRHPQARAVMGVCPLQRGSRFGSGAKAETGRDAVPSRKTRPDLDVTVRISTGICQQSRL